MRKFKICVCFSGTLRFIDYTLDHFDEIFNVDDKNLFLQKFSKYGFDDIEVDYFFYASNRNDMHEANKIWMNKNKINFTEKVNLRLINILKKNKRTRKIFIENDFEFLINIIRSLGLSENFEIYSSISQGPVPVSDSNFRNLHQFYAAEKCNDLKKFYEKTENFTYDLVVRCRTDVLFASMCDQEKVSWLESFYLNSHKFFTHGVPHEREGELCFFDPFFYSSSRVADVYFCNMTDFIIRNAKQVFKPRLAAHAEKIWGLFIKKNNIEAEEGEVACKILRAYDPEFKDFIK